jgi:hypothetical protein
MFPLNISLAILFMNEAINLLGKLGALRDRSSSLMNLDLVSESILKTDFSLKPSSVLIFC